MRTPRIVIPGSPPESGLVLLSGSHFNHLIRVLRRKNGDPVELIFHDGGLAFEAVISCVNSLDAQVEIAGPIELPKTASITLFCGICKPKTMDFITSKSVELAVSSLCFFGAERSQGAKYSDRAVQRIERLERVADSAMEQSGAHSAKLSINICNSLENAFQLFHPNPEPGSSEHRLLFEAPKDEGTQTPTIIHYFASRTDYCCFEQKLTDPTLQSGEKPAESYLVIGPEGGLTAAEETLAIKQYGYQPVSLGLKALRVETAVVAAGAITGLALQRQ